MNLSEVKHLTDTPGDYPYDRAHRELSSAEQSKPCTCQRKAKQRTGGAYFPSRFEAIDADPDCELHFPWMIEDDNERVLAMRWWDAGYAVGFATASTPDGGSDEPRFSVHDFDSFDSDGIEHTGFCVVDSAQVGSDGERFIVGHYTDEETAEAVRDALVACYPLRIAEGTSRSRDFLVTSLGDVLKIAPMTNEAQRLIAENVRMLEVEHDDVSEGGVVTVARPIGEDFLSYATTVEGFAATWRQEPGPAGWIDVPCVVCGSDVFVHPENTLGVLCEECEAKEIEDERQREESEPSDKFDEYIEHGKRAAATHPDYPDGVDFETAAVDTIASILHAVYGREPWQTVAESSENILDRALRSFKGDYEDLGRKS